MTVLTFLVALAWVVFALVWIVGAFLSAKTVRSAPGWDRFLVAAVVFAALVLARGGFRGAPYAVLWPAPLALRLLGVPVLYAGLAFALWARVTLGRLWSGRVTLKEGHRVVREGPYAHVRHPIYTGILAMALGSALAQGDLAALVFPVGLFVAFLLKMRTEERLLTEQFGEEYLAYAREVKRLVPGVW